MSTDATAASTAESTHAFEFAFELEADDVARYGEHLALTGEFYLSQMMRTRRILAAICVVVLAIFALLERDPAATLIMAVAVAIVGAVMWITWPKRWRGVVRQQSRRQASMEHGAAVLGPKSYRIDTQGLSFSGLYSGGYALWPAIARVTSDEYAVYLHISQASAHILPRRAFGSAEEFSAFTAWAQAMCGTPAGTGGEPPHS